MTTLYIAFEEMAGEFRRVCLKTGFSPDKAKVLAGLFAENSLDGVITHGVDRFARFIEGIRQGKIVADAEPEKKGGARAMEQWDGGLGPGPLNALFCTDRAIELARHYGVGAVALAHTNHWMRGGTYGWRAAKAGFLFIGWTNTIQNLPAWGAQDPRLGNNPLVLGVPHGEEAVVLDMALSQFSYGKLEAMARAGKELPVAGGFDRSGALTREPAEILQTWRSLSIGYWKGAGLSLLLDLMVTLLSGGLSTHEITAKGEEYDVSQVFIAFELADRDSANETVAAILADLHGSKPAEPGPGSATEAEILHPGERALRNRRLNRERGIPVDPGVWEQIKGL